MKNFLHNTGIAYMYYKNYFIKKILSTKPVICDKKCGFELLLFAPYREAGSKNVRLGKENILRKQNL